MLAAIEADPELVPPRYQVTVTPLSPGEADALTQAAASLSGVWRAATSRELPDPTSTTTSTGSP